MAQLQLWMSVTQSTFNFNFIAMSCMDLHSVCMMPTVSIKHRCCGMEKAMSLSQGHVAVGWKRP